MNPEIIRFECLNEAISQGVVSLPEKGLSGCVIPVDSSIPLERINVSELPSVVCSTCNFGNGSEGKVRSTEQLQFIGSNPVYYETQLGNRCKLSGAENS